MNFKNFSRAQFSKLRNGINGVGEFRYDTIMQSIFRINRITGLEIVRRDQNFTQTHGHTHIPWVARQQSSFSNLSVPSPTSQLIVQPFRRFTYVTAHSPTLPLLHLRHSSFSNPSFASPRSQPLHLRHLASRP